MNVRNCRKCGKLFNYVSGMAICPACKEESEKKFTEVKEYIREHRGASVNEVARECDVEESQIKQWVREERLEFSTGEGIGIVCEICGIPIPMGRYCEKCKANMVNSLSSASERPQQIQKPVKKDTRDNPKMRFLDR